MAAQQTILLALVALVAAFAQVNAQGGWNTGRATFYGKDGW
jgi:hypothetical protein